MIDDNMPDQYEQMGPHRKVMANESMVPMYFKWQNSSIVDGRESEVIATFADNIVALSFEQGGNIDYDPEIEIDTTEFEALDHLEFSLPSTTTTNGYSSFLVVGGIIAIFAISLLRPLKKTKPKF